MEQSNEKLVNSNIGITNIIERDEIRNTMMKTFIELAQKLKSHCGPYSGTAILTNPEDPLAEPVFTKDGINIVRSMKYAAPMQDFVRKQLAYMGARIERSAGDGTTSTMIIMAYTLASLLEYLKQHNYVYSTHDIASTWQKLVDRVVKRYNDFAKQCLEISDSDKIRFIAASQAYTSSHGDTELATCIGELFGNTPREVWDTLTIQKAVYESEEKYKVTVTDAEYTLDNVRLFPQDKCNADLGTVLDLKDVRCIIQDVVAIGDDNQKAFHEHLQSCIEGGEKLLVFTSDTMDNTTREHYQDLFTNNPKHNVIFVMCPSEDAYLNDINAITAIHYEDKRETDEFKSFKADVYFSGSNFRILKGLIHYKENEVYEIGINPYYKDKEHPDYNAYINALKEIIDREKSDVTRVNTRVIQRFIRILRKLIATRDVVFTVGGAAYDNAAAQDVAMDALLATKCSLTKGFVAGRCVTLKRVLSDLLNNEESDAGPLTKIRELYMAYIKALLGGIEEVDRALEDSVGVSDNIMKALEYKDAPVDFTRLDDPSYEIPVSLEQALIDRKDYCILEPIQTDITFIKRFGEIGLKFLTANRVIVDGYLYESNK